MTFTMLQSDIHNQFHIKFIKDELKSSKKANEDETAVKKAETDGTTWQTWRCDYPLLAYNSLSPECSEIILSSLAEKDVKVEILDLGEWQFICFVRTTNLAVTLNKKRTLFSRLHCQIPFLAKNRADQKVQLMVIDKDPWSRQEGGRISVKVLKTCEIKLPPMSLEKLRSVHLLVSFEQEDPHWTLLFQYTDELWSVSLSQFDRVACVLDSDTYKIQHRLAIRRINDHTQIYLIVETSSKSQIMKIVQLDEEQDDQDDDVKRVEIFESHAQKILTIEPDPNNSEYIFLVDEEQMVKLIWDKKDSKAVVL